MRVEVDWGIPQPCDDCGIRLRPRSADADEWPNTRPHHGKGLCRTCSNKLRSTARRRRNGVQPRTKPRRNPTVAELVAAGHPCVSPAPMPSRVRSYPL